jgi:protein-S-isoprenylcysteine O-methyltransferase Ste14
MWLIRISLCVLLISYYSIFGYLKVRDPKKYKRNFENKIVNPQIITVIVYNLLCYAMVILPPAGTEGIPYYLLLNPTTHVGFVVLGVLLIVCGLVLSVIAVIRRKAIGGQDSPEGLVTSGVYSYFRHPIYTGIVWVCLGLPLLTRNLDGLIMFPVVLAVNMSAALMEERFEVGVRFRDQYRAYKRTTAMFGPKWIWCVIVLILLTLVAAGFITT